MMNKRKLGLHGWGRHTFLVSIMMMAWMMVAVPYAAAQTKFVRVMWNDSPDQNVVEGFTATNGGAYLKYGTSTNAAGWSRADVTRTETLGESETKIVSQFVQLSNLSPNTRYYMQACDSIQCGTRYWFKTMGSAPQDMTFIAGGDSRTNRSVLQTANKMVAKIRPDFVYFGGDLTDNAASNELALWLQDWELSYPTDSIDGMTWKYIPGLVVAVGNHEDYRMDFVCTVFGAEKNNDGRCTNRDTYGAISINGSQMRLYNLNSQLRSLAAEHQEQTDWMIQDLKGPGKTAQWRIAGYHVPALPRTSYKQEYTPEMLAWNRLFFEHKVNVAFESDAHVMKVTAPVKPSDTLNDYDVISSGTVYIGEGAWGAPLRDADRPAAWLKDLASDYNFHVLQFKASKLEVRTVLFNVDLSKVGSVTLAQRQASASALPSGLPIRKMGTQEVYSLVRDTDLRTKEAPLASLVSGTPISGISVAKDEGKYFEISVPAGKTSLELKLSGANGDADLYVSAAVNPTLFNYDFRSAGYTSNEAIVINTPVAGKYYILVHGYDPTTALSLTATAK